MDDLISKAEKVPTLLDLTDRVAVSLGVVKDWEKQWHLFYFRWKRSFRCDRIRWNSEEV